MRGDPMSFGAAFREAFHDPARHHPRAAALGRLIGWTLRILFIGFLLGVGFQVAQVLFDAP